MATPTLDFGLIADRVDLPAILAREGIELRRGKAFCPFHANDVTPALSVYLKEGRWRYRCHGCGAAGDGIAWVAAREGIDAIEAARRLGEEGGYIPTSPIARPVAPPRPEPVETWRDPSWQVAAEGLIAAAEDRLWAPAGREALRWLRGRGLADHTIRRFRIGFVAEPTKTEPVEVLRDRDGEHGIYAPRGVTLPWLASGACHRDLDPPDDRPRWVGCNVRRLATPDVFAQLPHRVEKCLTFRGSSRGYLYPWPDILHTQGSLPMLLVEGEFDALIGIQEAGHLLHVATAGSASVRSLPLATRSALALATKLLLAFDHDEAGVDAAWNWKEKYPEKAWRVLLPHGSDLNDFVLQGGNVEDWLRSL